MVTEWYGLLLVIKSAADYLQKVISNLMQNFIALHPMILEIFSLKFTKFSHFSIFRGIMEQTIRQGEESFYVGCIV